MKKIKKLNLDTLGSILGREEMKMIMAGSDGSGSCNNLPCAHGQGCGTEATAPHYHCTTLTTSAKCSGKTCW